MQEEQDCSVIISATKPDLFIALDLKELIILGNLFLHVNRTEHFFFYNFLFFGCFQLQSVDLCFVYIFNIFPGVVAACPRT